MGKVIILKTGETAGEADIRVMQYIDLIIYLDKVRTILEQQEGTESWVKSLELMILQSKRSA